MIAAVRRSPVDWRSASVLPRLDARSRERVRRLQRAGALRGNRPDVFAKVGDSITAAPEFLTRLPSSEARLDRHSSLMSTIDFFARRRLAPGTTGSSRRSANSFDRQSWAAADGWTAETVVSAPPPPPPYSYATATMSFTPFPPLAAGASPLLAELGALRPSLAIVMLGTNDVWLRPLPAFQTAMAELVDQLLERDVIPILSTVPPGHWNPAEAPPVDDWNAVVVSVATERGVPLVNLWRALRQPQMIREGIAEDGVHLSVAPGDGEPASRAAVFTPAALRYGQNLRNLLTLKALERVMAVLDRTGAREA